MARKTSKREVTAVGIAEERLHLLGRSAWEIDQTAFKLQTTVIDSRELTALTYGSSRLGR